LAFNKAPSQSTYQTKDVELIMAMDNRDAAGTKDVIALNGFYDIVQDKATKTNKYVFMKREGLIAYPFESPSAVIRGIFYWEEENKYFVAYDNKIAIVTASTGALVTTVTPFITTTGEVGWTEFYFASGDVKIVACDGSRIITIDSSNVVVNSTSPDLPTPMKPNVVYLDGYLFVIKDGTSDIYNSNLDNPLLYTAGDFITAEMLPDTLVRISRLNNYLVAFGTASIEYFFDAANASGSPLNRNDTPLKQVGYLGGLAAHDNAIYFVGQAANTEPQVMKVEDFRLEMIGSPPLRRYLEPNTAFEGCIISQNGHNFYVLKVGLITYCMDMDTGIWTRMAFKQTSVFQSKFAQNMVINGVGNSSIVVLEGDTKMYYFSPNIYQDDGVNFTVTVQTEKQMFDTMHEKYMSRVLVVADRPPSNANLLISFTDDDYQTYSTPRSVNLNQEAPILHRWGRFRRRAFKLDFTENAPHRVEKLEVDFNIGSR